MGLITFLNIHAFVMLLGGNAIDLKGRRYFLRQDNKPVQGASQVNPSSNRAYQVIKGGIYGRE